MSNRSALMLTALLLVPVGAGAQERTVVSNQIAISGRDASLTIEFADGARTELSFRDGTVWVDGEGIGSYASGDALALSWRGLLGEAVSLSSGPLARALVDWSPPTGLSDELTRTGAALDGAIESAILGRAPEAPASEQEGAARAGEPGDAAEAQGASAAARDPAAAPQAPDRSAFSAPELSLGQLLRSPRLLEVLGAIDDLDLEEVHAFVGEDVDVRAGQRVEGTVLVIDGDLDVRGEVDGDVVLAGGRVRLHDGGRIRGDLRLMDARYDNRGGELDGSRTRVRPQATVDLERLRDDLRMEIRRELEDQFENAYSDRRSRSLFSPFRHIWGGIAGVFQNLLAFGIVCALGALALYFWPARVEVVAATARESLPKSAMVGLAGAFLFLPVWVIGTVALAISIVGIPALLAWVPLFPIAGGVAALFGFLAVSMIVGDWVQEKRIRGFEWADGSSALMRMMAGVFAVTVLFMAANVLRMGGPLLGFFHGLLSFAACLALIAMMAVGFGAVLLSRGGRRTYTEGAFLDEDWSWRSWRGDAPAETSTTTAEVVDAPEDEPSDGGGEGNSDA